MQNTYLQKKNKLEPTFQSAPKEAKNGMPILPNSLLLAMHGGNSGHKGNPELENIMKSRLAAFHRQIPVAENEADKLSSGITSGTPEQVKQSMGERLGTDFSSVRFHTGESFSQKADNMGARAWTQGNDVYFGEGGFHPTVAAHELVHTAQQGAVDSSAVNVSAPMGGVQMWGLGLGKWLRKLFCCGPSQVMPEPRRNHAMPRPRRNHAMPRPRRKDAFSNIVMMENVLPQEEQERMKIRRYEQEFDQAKQISDVNECLRRLKVLHQKQVGWETYDMEDSTRDELSKQIEEVNQAIEVYKYHTFYENSPPKQIE